MNSKKTPKVAIVLAGGKGTRMRTPGTAKVCLPIAGKPAVLYLLDALHRTGFQSKIVVTGVHAENVMRTVSQVFPETMFAFQAQQRGTGHAARCGAALLQQLQFEGHVLVAVGDRLIKPQILEKMMRLALTEDADLVFLTGKKEFTPDAGRVVLSLDGKPIASIEKFDSGRSRLLAAYFAQTDRGATLEASRALSMARDFLGAESKIPSTLGELYETLENGAPLDRKLLQKFFSPKDRLIQLRNGRQMTGAEVEKSRYVNLSIYLFKAGALFSVLSQLQAKNAQHEEYLTDAIEILAAEGRKIVPYELLNSDDSISYNTPEELKNIEELVLSAPNGWSPVANNSYAATEMGTRRSPAPGAGAIEATGEPDMRVNAEMKSIASWLALLQETGTASRWIQEQTGIDREAAAARIPFLRKCFMTFAQKFGDGSVLVIRAPGRVNIMGRHIDHQGGLCHSLAIDREVFVLARKRDDRLVRLENLHVEYFPSREFRLEELAKYLQSNSWPAFLNLPFIRRARDATRGDWSHYVRGALARLQLEFPGCALKGMDILVAGNIPFGAGLSSSSALLVAVAQAARLLNDLKMEQEQFIELCAEAEWFVGTQGGGADHAAIMAASPEKICQIQFFPLSVQTELAWPRDEVSLLVCDSGQRAHKNAGARALYNQRVACYELGLAILHKHFPAQMERVRRIADLRPEVLQVGLPDFYRMLRCVPERISGSELAEQVPQAWESMSRRIPEAVKFEFTLRGVLLFGIGECARSRVFQSAARQKNWKLVGKLMQFSHDGDRVSGMRHGTHEEAQSPYSDGKLQALAEMAGAQHKGAELCFRRGAYGCSTERLDQLVDASLKIPGVLGAQMGGAGLGGCVMVLLQAAAEADFIEHIERAFYHPRKLPVRIYRAGGILGCAVMGV